MITEVYSFLSSKSVTAKRFIWKRWYQIISNFNRSPEFTFMNYGYENEQNLALEKDDEPNILFIQLYHKVLSTVSVANKLVLEVGSGRGGGASYVAKYLKPKKLIGIDFSQNAIDLCKGLHKYENLEFQLGDSENLQFENNTFDIIYNVESSHCYGSRKKFASEVFKTLKTGGYFCWADLCNPKEWDDFNKSLSGIGFRVEHSENITKNVLQALEKITDKKEEAINLNVPKLFRKTFRDFAGVKDTRVYNAFKSGKLQYFLLCLRK